MAYKNKGGQSRERTMIAAYSLVEQFGAKQKDVATALDCAPSTIHQWVKDIRYQREISDLKYQLDDARDYIDHLADQLQLEYQHNNQPDDEFEPDDEFDLNSDFDDDEDD
ncbi:helix-turn-helix domain-containing protein [Proteus mirabilis]|uniref:helix-turn-helix domain-containing protein n=2 Tax=Proteus TaxID=583 RepID=UPI001F04BA43|nr:helix-turn-helix domain-containing protein [Proteus mirabilis]